jgi:hypothetical protein
VRSVVCRRRMTGGRLLTAGLGALLAFALQPVTAGRAGTNTTSNSQCPISAGIPAVTGQVLTFTGSLSCFRPGGASFGSNAAPPNTQQRVPAGQQPTLGQSCQNTNNYPVTFTEDAAGGEFASYSFSGGSFKGRQLTGSDLELPGTNDAYVTDLQFGSYEPSDPSNPGSPLACQLETTFHFFCPRTGVLDQLCLTPVVHPINPGLLPSPPWAPYFAAELGKIKGEAGQIHSAPATHGVVNTPVCFWVENIGIPQERDLTLTLASAPDASGRQIFYTYAARIQFTGVTWQFDDGSDTSPVPPADACKGLAPPDSQLTAHQYRQISDGHNPDNTYHVTATEQYSISVVQFWSENDGPHGPIPVFDPTVQAPTLNPTMDTQFVGQVEGIPIGSP